MWGGECILKTLVEHLFRGLIPSNEGYDYLFSDNIYLPVYQTTLLITKRVILPLNLVEEKVLQLIEAKVFQIDEIAQILGLERNLLDVTIADLYTKEMIFTSSNACRLLIRGRDALQVLSRTERKQEYLKDVYMDAITGEILLDLSQYQLSDNVYDDDCKLRSKIIIGDLESYSKKFSEISEIFNSENRSIRTSGSKSPKEEMIRIENIENTYVKFVKIPICVFVSSNGFDIDVATNNPKANPILSQYKDEIIEQIIQKKVLKKHFKRKNIRYQYDIPVYNEKNGLKELLKRAYFNKNKSTNDLEELQTAIFSNRKLLNGEAEVLIKHFSNECNDLEIMIDNLDDWAYDSRFTTQLTSLQNQNVVSIIYNESSNPEKSQKQISYSFNKISRCIKQINPYFICWNFENKIKIYGLPNQRSVINEQTKTIAVDYYINVCTT